MTRAPFLALALVFLLSACAPLNSRDRHFLEGRGLSDNLQRKMRHHEPLTLDDIIELSQKRIPGPFIVHYLQPTYFVYKLTAGDADRLRKAGVEDGVIRYLAMTPTMFSPTSNPNWYEDDPHFNDDYRSYSRY